jgi:GTP-binding protein Era
MKSGFVAVVGKPNVGKSTLINHYVGERVAIVSPKPQTTRRVARGILTREDAQVIFVDTPGIHKPEHALGSFMVRAAQQTLGGADVIVFMTDGSEMPDAEDKIVARFLRERASAPILLALNKMDRLDRDQIKEVTEAHLALVQFDDWMRIAATRGAHCDKLLDQILARLPEGPLLFPGDEYTDQSAQNLASELIREQVLAHTRQEIPHAVAVAIDEWEERSEKLTYIAATIYVEKDSQKGIVIGARGAMLKTVGQAARKEIERLLGHKVYLELTVKVWEHWRRDEKHLRELGYAA